MPSLAGVNIPPQPACPYLVCFQTEGESICYGGHLTII